MRKVISMRGQPINMLALAQANAQKVALGNANLNARGDKLGQHGTVIATREQVLNDYNTSNPKAVKHVGLNSIAQEVLSPVEAVRKTQEHKQAERPGASRRRMSETET